MLGFSPVSSSSSDQAAAGAFARGYDKAQYEAKVSQLFQDVYALDRSVGRAEVWEQSLDALAHEDIYLAEIIRKTGLRTPPVPWYLPRLSSLKRYLPAAVMVVAGILVAFTPIGERLVPHPVLRTFLVLCCWLTPWILGKLARAHGDEDMMESGAEGEGRPAA
jgi:hypothetical protein